MNLSLPSHSLWSLTLVSWFHLKARRGSRILDDPHYPTTSPHPTPTHTLTHYLYTSCLHSLGSGFFLGQSRVLLSRLKLQKVFVQTHWDVGVQPVGPEWESASCRAVHCLFLVLWTPPLPLLWDCWLCPLPGPQGNPTLEDVFGLHSPQRQVASGGIFRGGPSVIPWSKILGQGGVSLLLAAFGSGKFQSRAGPMGGSFQMKALGEGLSRKEMGSYLDDVR